MARLKIIVIAALLNLGMSCASLRTIELCQIDLAAKVNHCSLGDEEEDKPPEYVDLWIAATVESWDKIAQKLQQCEEASGDSKK